MIRKKNAVRLGCALILGLCAWKFNPPPARSLGWLYSTASSTGAPAASVPGNEPRGDPNNILSSPTLPTRSNLEPKPISVARLVAEIQEAFDSFSIPRLDFALTELLPALVKADPAAAGQLAESLERPELRAEVLYWVALWWGQKDPERALAWATGLVVEHERETALTLAASQLASADPATALQVTAPSLRPDQTSDALGTFAQRWAEKDLAAALRWTLALSPGAQREALVAQLAFVAAERAPAVAARLVVEEMSPGVGQNEAALSVLHQWGLRDFYAAKTWVARFPAGPLHDRAVAELNAIAEYRLADHAASPTSALGGG